MRASALLPLLLIPLAGCLSDDASDSDDPLDAYARKPALEFRDPVDLASKAGILDGTLPAGAFGTNCQDSLDDGDCGLGEPSVEVDGAGTIYVSGVCCLTVSPPVLVSRDGGETFQTLDTADGIREAFGIEGDFAIDEVGRVYFADIEFAATFQVTVWGADGSYQGHAKWPAPPLVDRDWIRAEGDGTAYYIYNTGAATNVYKSTDAGQTWSPIWIYQTAYGLGNAAIWPGHELCLFGGDIGGQRSVDCSTDGGATWDVQPASLPNGDDAYPVGAFDETGRLFLGEAVDGAITITHRDTDGVWSDQLTVVSPPGTHRMPWITAGADGAAAFAWYGTNDTTIGPDTEWFLFSAASRNAADPDARWDWTIADDKPVFVGELGRDLLDFLQIDMGPDGALHIAYSKLGPDQVAQSADGNEEQLFYVRGEPSPLAMTDFFYGP